MTSDGVYPRAVSHHMQSLSVVKLMPLVPTVRQEFRRRATEIGLMPLSTPPSAQPNTRAGFDVYNAKSFPATVSPLVLDAWRDLLCDYPGELGDMICGMIQHGAKLGYSPQGGLRFRSRRLQRNLPMDEGGEKHVEEELMRRLEQGVVLRADDDSGHLVTSPLGAVPKPMVDGIQKWRTIHHLSWPRSRKEARSVNAGIDSEAVTLRYYDLDGLMKELGAASRRDPENKEGRTLWKVDLKDAYRHVVVEREDARLLGYYWSGLGYMYEGQLSFGGKSAPFLFNLVAEGFEWILRYFGVRCNHYLDDSFGWVDGTVSVNAVTELVTDIAGHLGLSTSPHKTLSGPVLEVLGITIDCHRAVAYIGETKMGRIRQLIQDVLSAGCTSLAAIQSLAGSLVFVTRVCTIGKSFLRRVFDQMTVCMAQPFRKTRLTQDTKRELRWWSQTLTGYDAIRYLSDDPSFLPVIQVWSDASGRHGIGGHLEGSAHHFSERIPRKHQNKDIMFKEALAVLRCVDHWKAHMARKLVVFNVDNKALVAALNRGGCRQRATQAIVRRIYTLAAWHSFSLRAVWLSSASNKRADDLSRFVLGDPSTAVDLLCDYAHFDPDFSPDDMESMCNGNVVSDVNDE